MRLPHPPTRRDIANHTGSRAFAPDTRTALDALGYDLVPGRRAAKSTTRPELRLADDRHLERLPSIEEDPDTPVICLTGARKLAIDDPRVIHRVRRPAALNDLYSVLQKTLEQHPRRVPRVETRLAARCIREERRWPGALLSLSEGGCLIRSSEAVDPGEQLAVQFALPADRLLSARGRCVYGRDHHFGVEFTHATAELRQSIQGFVQRSLVAR